MSSTGAIEEWGIESSTLRKRINDFPKAQSVKLELHMLCLDLECAVSSVRIKVNKNKIGGAINEESHKEF